MDFTFIFCHNFKANMLSLFVAQLNKNFSRDNTFAGYGFEAWREQFKSMQGTKRDKKQWRKVKPM